jgi:hypothetical protein
MRGECATLRGKISKKSLKSLKRHEIKRKIICFRYKIEIYFIREHQLFYFHSWLRYSWKYCICFTQWNYISILHAKQKNILYILLSTWILWCFTVFISHLEKKIFVNGVYNVNTSKVFYLCFIQHHFTYFL